MIPLIDTHIWLWWLLKSKRLYAKDATWLNKLVEGKTPPLLADISVWECTLLYQAGKIDPNMPFEKFIELATSPEVVQLVPIHAKVSIELSRLPNWFHKDPADRLIVASALAVHTPLMTVDERIIKSGIVPIFTTASHRTPTSRGK